MAKNSKTNLKRGMTFSANQVMLFVLAFAAVGAIAIWQSLAAPHNGGGKPGGGSATLVLDPTSVASGGFSQASGCGYTQGLQTNVVVNSPSSRTFFPTGVDTSGCVSFGVWTSEAGAYTVQTYQSPHSKQTLKASASLTVY